MKEKTEVNLDPLDVNGRLYRQIARLLDQLESGDEEITMPQRINALIAVGRIQTIFATLRLRAQEETPDAGSAVRKYASAFAQANGARGSKRAPRSTLADFDADTADDTAN